MNKKRNKDKYKKILDDDIELLDIDGESDGKKLSKGKIIINTLQILGCILMLLLVLAYGVFHYYYKMLDYRPDNLVSANDISVSDDSIAEFVPYDIYDQEPRDIIIDGTDEGEFYNGYVDEMTDEELAALRDDLKNNVADMEGTTLYDTDTFNLLLIGVDSRVNGFSGRSDCMIVVSIDKKSKNILMTSVLRDTFVTIPGYSDNRINASYAWGGSSLLVDTIQKNFGIRIDRCVAVNFYLVKDFVDAVGGVDIYLTSDVIGVMNGYINEMNNLVGNPKGTDTISTGLGGTVVHLNGNQALAYARVRYVGTDFARTERQREVINLCLNKVKGMSLTELNSLAEQFLPRVRTDLTEADCASLLMLLVDISSYNFDSMHIPVDGSWSNANIRGMAVLTVDFKANSEAWYKKVTGQE